jgi:predicted ATPase
MSRSKTTRRPSRAKVVRQRGAAPPRRGEAAPALLLRSVELERFKGVFESGPIPLQPFTVLVGRNGSGKSTLLEALQWVDTALRWDARVACARYGGLHDLIHVRSRESPRHFSMRLQWGQQGEAPLGTTKLEYRLEVQEQRRRLDTLPHIVREELSGSLPSGDGGAVAPVFIGTLERGERVLYPEELPLSRMVEDPERLALGMLGGVRRRGPGGAPRQVLDFWERAVFLRLSPQRLVADSQPYRKSFEPLLDEAGNMLPALLNELKPAQRKELLELLRGIFENLTGMEVIRSRQTLEEAVNFLLKERMTYAGLKRQGVFPLPAWVLSEGTRRLVAICALLVHQPPPSLLCIEEIENGLDPWTVIYVLRLLQSAAARGTQVLLTTHSPWLLDHVPLEAILYVQRLNGETHYSRFASRKEVQDFSASVPPGAAYVNLENP